MSKNLTYMQQGIVKEKTPEEIIGELLEGVDELEKETTQFDFLSKKQAESENEYKKEYAKLYLLNKHHGDEKQEQKGKGAKTVNEVENKTVIDTADKKLQSDLDKALVDVQKQKIKNCVTKIDVYRSLLSFIKSDKDFSGYQP